MRIIITLCMFFSLFSIDAQTTVSKTKSYRQLEQEFVDMRFGMFICYNIMSYGAKWGEANYPIASFNPQKLDCEQWAKSAKSANMTFGMLTTKHHEGFCLWDSKFTKYDVASTPYKKDIVRQYVDAFRKNNLKVGLYYSIWDSTQGIDKGTIGPKEMDFIKGQIRELLTNYGKIDYFVVDGWFWRMGHKEVPYIEIRELIRELQPDCLITDHTHLQAPYQVDIPYYEGPFGAFPEVGNTMPSALGHCSVKGNGWFWGDETPNGLQKGESTETIVEKLNVLESRNCNFMLNCMPNRDGLLDPLFVNLLQEIGTKWEPNINRKPLPKIDKQLVYTALIKNVAASSGEAYNLIDASQYGTEYKHWESNGTFPQSITLDLGGIYSGIDVLQIIPNHRCKPAPETALSEGNITKCNVLVSKDGITFKKVASEEWSTNSDYRSIAFGIQPIRYIKIEILKAVGKNAIIAELNVGSSCQKPQLIK